MIHCLLKLQLSKVRGAMTHDTGEYLLLLLFRFGWINVSTDRHSLPVPHAVVDSFPSCLRLSVQFLFGLVFISGSECLLFVLSYWHCFDSLLWFPRSGLASRNYVPFPRRPRLVFGSVSSFTGRDSKTPQQIWTLTSQRRSGGVLPRKTQLFLHVPVDLFFFCFILDSYLQSTYDHWKALLRSRFGPWLPNGQTYHKSGTLDKTTLFRPTFVIG